eukprot:c3231_g1_i1 orf=288-572(+)
MEKKQKNSKTPYIILAILALALLLLLLTIIYFSLLKPQKPLLAVEGILLQNPNPNPNKETLTEILQGLTLRMNISLQNPNRGPYFYGNVGASME